MAGTLVSSNVTIKVSDGVGQSSSAASVDYTVPANSYVIISSVACSSYASGAVTISITGNGQAITHQLATFSATGTTFYSGGVRVGPDEIIRIANSGSSTGNWIGVLYANTP